MFIILPFLIIVLLVVSFYAAIHDDRFLHPEEYSSKGKAGERIVYNTLLNKYNVPEEQIFRNVYIPKEGGGTSEIDIVIISKKGLFVIECKNYAGNIYGDGKRDKWIQYIGKKKSYFYNPFLQNRSHIKNLRKNLEKFGDIPIISLVSTIKRGKWKVKNLNQGEYLLGYNSHFNTIYESIPESELMAMHFNSIKLILQSLSRPDASIREAHIQQVQNHK